VLLPLHVLEIYVLWDDYRGKHSCVSQFVCRKFSPFYGILCVISGVVNDDRSLKLRNNKAQFEALTGEYEEYILLPYDSV
jgi:hypothetical protein